MTTQDLIDSARTVRADLLALERLVEGSTYGPGEKSALARNIGESLARVDAVIEAAHTVRYVLGAPAGTVVPAP